MTEERLIILKLLEEGKINKEEAARLLEALDDEDRDNTSNHNGSYSSKKDSKKHKNIHIHHDDDFTSSFENFDKRMDDFGKHMEDFGEKFGERMSHIGVHLAEKSMGFAEKILDFVEKNVDIENLSKYNEDSKYKSYEEIYKIDAPEALKTLDILAKNGKIYLSSWDEDNISVKASIRALPEEYEYHKPILQTKKESSSVALFPKELEKLMIQLEVFVPSSLIDTIKANTKNAAIYIEDIECNKICCHTKNASIILKELKVHKEISCSTTNAKISFSDIIANHILAATKNAKVLIDNTSASKIETLTTNSKILVSNLIYDKLELIHLKTSNGKIEIKGDVPQAIGIGLEAVTTNGSIRTPFSMTYTEKTVGSTMKLYGKSTNYDSCNKSVSIKAFTTNDDILISN
ncbi:SHOCT-like domain-containing protein [Alkaliphilus peptidifermentans]|uniref:Putative adhesin n=1 Tax=Alkaliphilus peptidifermentans DSM 18978 TaxID=1120976 RepID=A0A1G5AW60_9FIRM|nr:DUF4097 family beta strand repeat-containing protein [Alkaliphilus peptidifermentans]SCX82081.1 Putative adhesin [Alkaliphilus peptidifermentans DSM 18978]